MTFRAVSSLSQETSSQRAGMFVARKIVQGFGDERLKTVILYATVNHDQAALLAGVREVVGPQVTVVGCSGQGVMGNGAVDEGGFVVGAMGLGGGDLKAAAARVDQVQLDTAAKGASLARKIEEQLGQPAKLMLLMYDPLCGIDVNQLLAGVHRPGTPVVGAAAGQPAGPSAATYQYLGTEAFSQGGVALGLTGDFTVDMGVSHGTTPTGFAMTLTRAEGNKLIELDGRPALEVWRESVGCSEDDMYNQDHSSGLAMGIERRVTGPGGREEAVYLIRAAFGFDAASGAIVVQAAIPEGSKIMFHHRTVPVVLDGAQAMGRELADRLQDRTPWAVLGFECGARTGPFLGASETLEENLRLQKTVAPEAPWLGLIGWGEIAPCGGVPEFHNYTYPLVVLS
jgi:hypothetical protein